MPRPGLKSTSKLRRTKLQGRYQRTRLLFPVWFPILCGVGLLLRFITWRSSPSGTPFFSLTRHREAKLAFFIQVSATSALRVPRLLNAIWHRNNVYIIHFDTKISLYLRMRMQEHLLAHHNYRNGNVLILESESVSYAGITMVLNTINAMSRLLRASPDWDFFINLSASDYPLVSPSTLRTLLGTQSVLDSHLNFVQNQTADNDMEWFFKRRMGSVHIDTSLWVRGGGDSTNLFTGSLQPLNVPHPVDREHVPLYKTEGWVILHRSFVEHVVDSALSRRLLLSFATSRAADELFFATLLVASKRFSQTIVWDALRFIHWGTSDKHLPRPAFLDNESDARNIRERLSKSGALFARKFLNPESSLISHIESNMSGIAECPHVDSVAVNDYTSRAIRRMVCVAKFRQQSRCQELP